MPPPPPAPSRRSRPAGGFTFLELMVVLAILAFAFTYAVLHLDGATGGARLSSAARQIGSTIEFLRGQAIQAHRTLELHIDLDNRQWTSVLPPRTEETEEERRGQEEVLYTDPVEFSRWIKFDGFQMEAHSQKTTGEVVVTFGPDGTLVPNGFMVRLRSDEIADREEASFSVEVNGLTGEVSYIPGIAPFEQVVGGDSF